jgi:hypothetical protein
VQSRLPRFLPFFMEPKTFPSHMTFVTVNRVRRRAQVSGHSALREPGGSASAPPPLGGASFYVFDNGSREPKTTESCSHRRARRAEASR